MAWIVPVVLVSCLSQAEAPQDSGEFIELMKNLHVNIKCVCFIFEGEMISLDRDGHIAPRDRPTLFQGLYALRPGPKQAGLLEIYESTSPDPPRHSSKAVFNGILEDSDRPMRDGRFIDPKTKKPKRVSGGPGSLNNSPSPEWFVYSWYFSAFDATNYPEMLFENLGWDEVDSHRCLKVKLGSLPGGKESIRHKKFWIDLNRGGHPLRVEQYHAGKLVYRVDNIELSQVTDVAGKNFWFPMKGVINVYGSLASEFHDYPIARETYGVVLGSLQLNRVLPDSAFVVHTKPRTELGNAVNLNQSHPITAPSTKADRPRSDPASVKARLDANLAEADKQAEEVRASSPAREPWDIVAVLQSILALVGVIAIVSAVVWRRRHS